MQILSVSLLLAIPWIFQKAFLNYLKSGGSGDLKEIWTMIWTYSLLAIQLGPTTMFVSWALNLPKEITHNPTGVACLLYTAGVLGDTYRRARKLKQANLNQTTI